MLSVAPHAAHGESVRRLGCPMTDKTIHIATTSGGLLALHQARIRIHVSTASSKRQAPAPAQGTHLGAS